MRLIVYGNRSVSLSYDERPSSHSFLNVYVKANHYFVAFFVISPSTITSFYTEVGKHKSYNRRGSHKPLRTPKGSLSYSFRKKVIERQDWHNRILLAAALRRNGNVLFPFLSRELWTDYDVFQKLGDHGCDQITFGNDAPAPPRPCLSLLHLR